MKRLFDQITKLIFTAIAISIASCHQLPDSHRIDNANYGQYPENYELTIKAYYQATEDEPENVQFNAIHKPVRYYLANKLGESHFGYLVCVTVRTPSWLNDNPGFRRDAFLLHNNTISKYVKGGRWWGEKLCTQSKTN